MAHANNPYTSADPCDNCGSRSCSKFVRCEECRAKGCDDCMILEEEPYAEAQTGYRDSYYICGECLSENGKPAPKVQYHQIEREYDESEVVF